MPTVKTGRPPLVSRGSFHHISLDPLAAEQLNEVIAFFAAKLDQRVSASGIARVAITQYAEKLAKLTEELPLLAEAHRYNRAARGRNARRGAVTQRPIDQMKQELKSWQQE